MGLTYVIIDIIKSSLGWKNNQKCLDSTSRMGLEDLAKSRRFFPGNTLYWMGVNSLYLWKEQEFKIVEEVWPPLKMKNKVGHSSSTILNSWSFQRYRPTKLWWNKNSNESDSIFLHRRMSTQSINIIWHVVSKHIYSPNMKV